MECPKCGQPRRPEQVTCDRCEVVFHKYERYLERKAEWQARRARRRVGPGARLAEVAAALLAPPETARDYWWAYAALWLVLALWGWGYISADIATLGLQPGFMHNINLPFHEAGHVVFRPFGDFVASLGGTLGQLLMPLICGGVLLYQRGDTFGASVCVWWLGQNLLDIAPYMADARAGELPLLGGNFGKSSPYGVHDWEFILGELGLLAFDKTLAAITLNCGRVIMVAALAWGAWLVWQAWTQRR